MYDLVIFLLHSFNSLLHLMHPVLEANLWFLTHLLNRCEYLKRRWINTYLSPEMSLVSLAFPVDFPLFQLPIGFLSIQEFIRTFFFFPLFVLVYLLDIPVLYEHQGFVLGTQTMKKSSVIRARESSFFCCQTCQSCAENIEFARFRCLRT